VCSSDLRNTLDQALVNRPNRFDSIINFGFPDEEKRHKILELYNNKYSAGIPEDLIREYARKTDKLTPAYINELIVYAKILAQDAGTEITKQHLETSLLKILPSAEKQREMYG